MANLHKDIVEMISNVRKFIGRNEPAHQIACWLLYGAVGGALRTRKWMLT